MITGDYHTHTKSSDAKTTMEENIQAAVAKNLSGIAITDHGLGLTYYKTQNFTNFKKSREQIEILRGKYSNIRTFLGVEASVLTLEGDIDLTREQVAMMDIIVCGFHRFMVPRSFQDAFLYYGYNIFMSPFVKPSKEVISRNTKAFISAVKKYPIDIISHINNFAVVDAYELSKACSDYGTYLELNEKHINQIEPVLDLILKTDVKLICNSDAHKASQIGVFENSLALIKKYNIDTSRIVNYDNIPVFKKK